MKTAFVVLFWKPCGGEKRLGETPPFLRAIGRNNGPRLIRPWLAAQPQIAIVARDRGGAYSLATKALPQATQVADRWHLMANASHAFLDAVRKSMRQIRSAIGAATVDPDLLTAAERLRVFNTRDICGGRMRTPPSLCAPRMEPRSNRS